MQKIFFKFATPLLLAVIALATFAQVSRAPAIKLPLDSLSGLDTVAGKSEIATYNGRRALHLIATPDLGDDDAMLAIVTSSDFKDGTIEVDVAGVPRVGADQGARGFIGIMFRVQDHGTRGENFYLRPTNGRADDQLRRNHSVQYESVPEFPWYRLRKETPGVYESYTDLQPGVWTQMKVVVSGTKAQLYVNGASQPCLIVNDLKHGDTRGQIALWAHSSTDGYFSNLSVQ